MAKTIKISQSVSISDKDLGEVQRGFMSALAILDDSARSENREVLWGTLKVEVEQRQIDDVRIWSSHITTRNNRVLVSALAVLK